jgi:hypothetical protein
MKTNKPQRVTRKEVWEKSAAEIDGSDFIHFVDRVACSGLVSETAVVVLFRLLRHRNPDTGLCCPSIDLLAMRLFPNLTPQSAHNKVVDAIWELKKAGIVVITNNRFEFRFSWGTGKGGDVVGEVNALLDGKEELEQYRALRLTKRSADEPRKPRAVRKHRRTRKEPTDIKIMSVDRHDNNVDRHDNNVAPTLKSCRADIKIMGISNKASNGNLSNEEKEAPSASLGENSTDSVYNREDYTKWVSQRRKGDNVFPGFLKQSVS